MEGGKKFGEGKTGATFSLFPLSASDKNSFMSLLDEWKKQGAHKATLYKTSGKQIIGLSSWSPPDPRKKNIIAKVIHQSHNPQDARGFFWDDLKMAQKVAKCYGSETSKYTTIPSELDFDGILGMEISHPKMQIYTTFQSQCDKLLTHQVIQNKLSKDDMNTFIKDILSSLIILQKHNLRHGDVKFDNIMSECHKESPRFKLIDWGFAKELTWYNAMKRKGIKPFLRGSSPLYYIHHPGLHWVFYIKNYIHDCMINPTHPKCISFAQRVYDNFYEKFCNMPNTQQKDIFEEFKYTTDLWSLGLMIYSICIVYDWEEYIPFAEALCLIRGNIKNAQQALDVFKMYILEKKQCGLSKGPPGAHGKLIDICCTLESTSLMGSTQNILCEKLQENIQNITQITLLNSTESSHINNKYQIQKLIDFLKDPSIQKNFAAKYFFTSNAHKDMLDDVHNAGIVNQIYKNNINYITTEGIAFHNMQFTGMQIEYSNDQSTDHMYFSRLCQKSLDKSEITNLTKKEVNEFEQEINTFLDDILSSLDILHKQQYYHGDVKDHNIMVCGTTSPKYKLIDWGRLYQIKTFDKNYKYGGSLRMGTPLGLYFMVRNKSKQLIPRVLAMKLAFTIFEVKNKCPLPQQDFGELWGKIKNSLLEQVHSTSTDEELFTKFKYTLDTYNVGLTLFHAVLLNPNIPLSMFYKYMKLISRMTIYNKNMLKDVESIQNYVSKM